MVKILKSCNVRSRTNHIARTHYGNEALNAFKCGQFVSALQRIGKGLRPEKSRLRPGWKLDWGLKGWEDEANACHQHVVSCFALLNYVNEQQGIDKHYPLYIYILKKTTTTKKSLYCVINNKWIKHHHPSITTVLVSVGCCLEEHNAITKVHQVGCSTKPVTAHGGGGGSMPLWRRD